jgi:hypothetical protein
LGEERKAAIYQGSKTKKVKAQNVQQEARRQITAKLGKEPINQQLH